MKTFTKVWLGIGLLAIMFGIGLLILTAASGATWRDIPTYSVKEGYDNVKSLDIQIGYGEVYIEEGDEFFINAEQLMEDDGFESYVTEEGTWVIDEPGNNNNFNLFGMRFPVRQLFQWNDDNLAPKIVITVPKGFIAREVSIDIAAGILETDVIRAEEGTFSVEAGEMKINQLQVTGKSQYSVGAGYMKLDGVNANNITVDCNMGNIEIDGAITGDNYISCGVGNIGMDLYGSEKDYSYEVESGIGNVSIDGEEYHNIGGRKIGNGDAVNSFSLDCGIGKISVDFH